MKIDRDLLKKFKKDYNDNLSNKVIEKAVAKVGLNDSCEDPTLKRRHNFVFSNTTKRGEITNQKISGRCWMFSALNAARVDTMSKLKLKTFEFSQNYTLFYDKLEKSNYFLESILETSKEKLDSRIVMHLLSNPIQDGGQWDMFSGLLEKYGIVPKSVMPETYHSSNTVVMNNIITSKLREYAHKLRTMCNDGAKQKELQKTKNEMLSHIYSILVKCLGPVPEKFDFEYLDQNNKYKVIRNIDPVTFFKKYVNWNLDNKVSLINAPTETKPFYKAYTVKYLGTVKELRPIRYINVPIEVLKKAAIKSIKDGNPVWFGCDVGKQSERKGGILDKNAFLYEDILNDKACGLNKGQRLDYGESQLTHAMLFTGVDLDEKGNPIKWQVENSWGGEIGNKGIFSMSDDWFDEYNYQIMVDKKYVDKKVLDCLKKEVVELEPWDPMGALAYIK